MKSAPFSVTSSYSGLPETGISHCNCVTDLPFRWGLGQRNFPNMGSYLSPSFDPKVGRNQGLGLDLNLFGGPVVTASPLVCGIAIKLEQPEIVHGQGRLDKTEVRLAVICPFLSELNEPQPPFPFPNKKPAYFCFGKSRRAYCSPIC